MKTQHTPVFVACDEQFNFSHAVLVSDPKAHELTTERATDGNIRFKYVPLVQAMSAPELLEALECLLSAHRLGNIDKGYWEDAHKVIKKAKGE